MSVVHTRETVYTQFVLLKDEDKEFIINKANKLGNTFQVYFNAGPQKYKITLTETTTNDLSEEKANTYFKIALEGSKKVNCHQIFYDGIIIIKFDIIQI